MRTICAWPMVIAAVLVVTRLAPAHAQPASGAPASTEPRRLAIANKPWTGDFDRMVERRMVRVLVPYSRTLFFNDQGRERGITAENVRDFEQYVNRKYGSGKRPITMYLVPMTRDKLLDQVAKGLGDIAAGNLTVTDERLRLVDFEAVDSAKPVKELVVLGASAPPIESVDDLAGKTVHVRRSSSYYESLDAVNRRFLDEGKSPMILKLVPDALEDEDMLEMANARLIDILVVDDWKARMWAQILPSIKVKDTVVVRDAGRVGWAFRKDSPKLRAVLNAFYSEHMRKQGVIEYRLRKYMVKVRQIKDPTLTSDWKRFEQTLTLFRKYGERYGFDPLMLAAQGYQESQLDQNAKSHVGAIGVMQVMPATGAGLNVGDIRQIEPNIHAGAKYMDQLMTRYFPDAHFSEANRPLFAFASYNAGPGNISRMRREAQKRGLDPDRWFNNVELVVAEKIGQETTTYVRNIYKYYVSYKLTLEAAAERQRAIESLKSASPNPS
jgi:membrane-bound lytic murein transglycosylase MltF